MFDFLTGKIWMYVAGALGVVSAGLLVTLLVRGAALTVARADIKNLQSDLKVAQISIIGYQTAVEQCNSAVARLKTVAAEKTAAADQALALARKESERHQPSSRRLAALTAAPTPSGAGCVSAISAIRREVGN